MKPDSIVNVEIDSQGRLLIYPCTYTYPFIYREAVEVHWNDSDRYLYSPKPKEWSYLDWFKHMISTVQDLELTSKTKWNNIPDTLRENAEAWMKSRKKQ